MKLVITLASVAELAEVATKLESMHVQSKAQPTSKVADTPTPSPVVEKAPPTSATPKKLTAAEKKALKKAQDEQEKADRIERLKAQMGNAPAVAETMPPQQPQQQAPAQQYAQPAANIASEDPNAIVEEIRQLGDKLNSFQGMPIEQKQQVTGEIMASINAPQGVRPTQLQEPLLSAFRDAYKIKVDSIVNPLMGGLV